MPPHGVAFTWRTPKTTQWAPVGSTVESVSVADRTDTIVSLTRRANAEAVA
jgi:hypothetical protein